MKKSILMCVKDYIGLRRLGINDAWEISGMSDVGDSLVGYVCVIAAIVVAVYFFIDYKSEYTSKLEKTLALCLSDTYKPIKIGDEWFLCCIDKLGK